jgi:hypothetical protein
VSQFSIADEEMQCQQEVLPREKLLATKDVLALISGDILKSSRLEVLECALMSGSALGKELNTSEEDEAWAHFNQGRSNCPILFHGHDCGQEKTCTNFS